MPHPQLTITIVQLKRLCINASESNTGILCHLLDVLLPTGEFRVHAHVVRDDMVLLAFGTLDEHRSLLVASPVHTFRDTLSAPFDVTGKRNADFVIANERKLLARWRR